MNLIDFFMQNNIKPADLRVLIFLKVKSSTLRDLTAVVNYYQLEKILPKLMELGMVKKEEERYYLIEDNDINKKLFS